MFNNLVRVIFIWFITSVISNLSYDWHFQMFFCSSNCLYKKFPNDIFIKNWFQTQVGSNLTFSSICYKKWQMLTLPCEMFYVNFTLKLNRHTELSSFPLVYCFLESWRIIGSNVFPPHLNLMRFSSLIQQIFASTPIEPFNCSILSRYC